MFIFGDHDLEPIWTHALSLVYTFSIIHSLLNKFYRLVVAKKGYRRLTCHPHQEMATGIVSVDHNEVLFLVCLKVSRGNFLGPIRFTPSGSDRYRAKISIHLFWTAVLVSFVFVFSWPTQRPLSSHFVVLFWRQFPFLVLQWSHSCESLCRLTTIFLAFKCCSFQSKLPLRQW